MSNIWIDQRHMRLKDFSASVKRAKSTVKIEIEVSQPGSLGFLLEQLREIEREQIAAEQKAKEWAAAAKRRKPPALPTPPLQLPYFPEERDQ